MGSNKKNKSSQSPRSTTYSNPGSGAQSNSLKAEAIPISPNPIHSGSESRRVQPEQMSLDAYGHIQKYLKSFNKAKLDKEDLTAVLRLSQHLRVFGLLSAVGYVNQSNAQEGKVRERTVPVWQSLLGQLLDKDNPPTGKQLMEIVVEMTKNEPSRYMATWRSSLSLANYWNFWARAYQED